MQSKQGLLLAAEVLSGLDEPVKAIREATPQARHSFTVADQVNQLVSAGEAGPRSRLHGAADGAVQPAPHQPRPPASVCPSQRPLYALHDPPAKHPRTEDVENDTHTERLIEFPARANPKKSSARRYGRHKDEFQEGDPDRALEAPLPVTHPIDDPEHQEDRGR